jgi:acyl carrier protein
METASEADVLASIHDIAEREIGLSPAAMTMSARIEEFDVDSLDVIRLALMLEKRWCVKLSPAEVAQALTVGDIVGLVTSRTKGR